MTLNSADAPLKFQGAQDGKMVRTLARPWVGPQNQTSVPLGNFTLPRVSFSTWKLLMPSLPLQLPGQ